MTDEEKKAIQYIKNCLDNEYNFKNATRQKDKKAYNIILNLIEKQSKIIDGMIQEYEYNARINLKNFCEDEMRKDKCIQDCRICVKKYFEERCK